MYRYRDNDGVTSRSLKRIKHLSKIGKIKCIKGYVYKGRYGVNHAAVMVKGSKGSCRFSGFSWGYGGEGPRGLKTFLESLAINPNCINWVLDHKWDENKTGEVWSLWYNE